MSLKPLKASEYKKLEAIMEKKRKNIEELHQLPPYTVIFSEGIKTEPFYIKGLTQQVNRKYSEFTSNDRIVVIGTGRNTRSLLEYARKMVSQNYPEFKVVWLMYDKDDFPYDDFDNTQFSAEGRISSQIYHVAWSNECIELWFVLHFQSLESNISREQYCDILRKYFPYEKSLENIYDILKDKTQNAIERAKVLYNSYDQRTPPSRRNPSTRVHELVEELQSFL
jgi:hypothetical protein